MTGCYSGTGTAVGVIMRVTERSWPVKRRVGATAG